MRKEYGLLLDFDGIVVDSEPLYERAMNRQFRRYGIRVGADDWLFFKGKDSRAVFAYLREKFDSRIDFDELHAGYKKELLDEFRKNMRYIPGFLDFFNACKTQFRDILVTSTSREIMLWTFENVPVSNIFSHMITATEVQNTKPHPEPYLKAAEKIGIPIERCIVLEDSLNGIRAGKAAGAKVIALTSTFGPEILKEADLIVDAYEEL
ncbi:MAG: HAD family phosphatase, partial [Candidatus Marinimicrobia bacterium]|nr:HAD family phosphatase [Candidatus Neomarinimicrobiota bacterium]